MPIVPGALLRGIRSTELIDAGFYAARIFVEVIDDHCKHATYCERAAGAVQEFKRDLFIGSSYEESDRWCQASTEVIKIANRNFLHTFRRNHDDAIEAEWQLTGLAVNHYSAIADMVTIGLTWRSLDWNVELPSHYPP